MPILLFTSEQRREQQLTQEQGMVNERANGSENENRNAKPTQYVSSNMSKGPRTVSLTKEV